MRDRIKVVPIRRDKRGTPEGRPHNSSCDKLQQMLRRDALHEFEARAIYDEKEFKRRFAASWARRDREWLIDFQRQHGLSDREIRWLNRSKSLRVKETGVVLIPSAAMAAYGWASIVILWVFVGVPMFGDTYLSHWAGIAMLVLSIGVLVLTQMTRWMWSFYILPGQISRRMLDRTA
ncbi:MAG TPA: hypothetical protein VGH80_07565 [Xanthomonadaceae bacterium]